MLRSAAPSLALVTGLVLASGCNVLTEPLSADAPDVRGVWQFAGTQVSPTLDLVGTISITGQNGAEIVGSATWEERDGGGGIQLDGGPLNGRVLSERDVDFDVTLLGGERRMVALLVADTLTGDWVQPTSNLRGTFRAVRTTP